MRLPVVAIVGRPNVGKSSLLNCLAGERVSIVEETPGVTRDRVGAIIEHRDVNLEVIDTGGIGIVDRDDLSEHIERQIQIAIHGADLILFVVDAKEGPMPLDREVARRLRREPGRPDEGGEIQRKVILVANKVDLTELEANLVEFLPLGFGPAIPVSAAHGFGRTDLLDRVAEELPPHPHPADPVLKLAVVGRQNVGKSTFVNSLAQEERVIVSEIPGTTRDAVDVRFEKDGRTFVVIDTAGVKKRARFQDSIEFYSQSRTWTAIRRADVALFLIDASAEITKVDKQIGELLVEETKPCVIVANKWDLTAGRMTMEAWAEYAHDRLRGLTHAPIAAVTAKDGRKVQATIDLAQSLFKRAQYRVGTGELNRLLESIKDSHLPAMRGTRPPKIFYATQVGVAPPTFVVFVNDPALFPDDYRRFLEGRFRENLPFKDIPLRIFYRARFSAQTEAEKGSSGLRTREELNPRQRRVVDVRYSPQRDRKRKERTDGGEPQRTQRTQRTDERGRTDGRPPQRAQRTQRTNRRTGGKEPQRTQRTRRTDGGGKGARGETRGKRS